jgi:hypothetical protein
MRQRLSSSRVLTPSLLALGFAALPGVPAAAGGPACRVDYAMASTDTHFTANVTITNTGGATIDGWTLRFTLAAGQVITTFRNAVPGRESGQSVAVNVATNGVVRPGASANLGFDGTHEGDTSAPTGFTVNRIPCAVT